MKYQTFIVHSQFGFPLDMLRYDACFPASGEDAGKIDRSLTNRETPLMVKIGRYVQNKSSMPTIRRWESFGCTISDIKTQ